CLCSSHTHPAPLAFPTRRSSDLHCCREVPWSNCCYKPDWLMADNNALRFRICRYGTSINPFCLFRIPVNITCCVINFAQRLMERSEEHTSELQSRFDLVCRLLLA